MGTSGSATPSMATGHSRQSGPSLGAATAALFDAAVRGVAGVVLRIVYKETTDLRPLLRIKLEALGFGFFVPIFFIISGVDFNLHALFTNVSMMLLVPVFLVALLLVRGAPAILYRHRLDSRHTAIAGLLQATSLTFIVAATQIGMQLGLITSELSAALVTAGLLSVIIYPLLALALLGSSKGNEKPAHPHIK